MANLTKQEKKLINLIVVLGIIILVSLFFLFTYEEKLTEENSVAVYFIESTDTEDFELIQARRKFSPESDKLLVAIEELLKGPNKKETKQGIFTEIPPKTELLGIDESDNKKYINLSDDFESGGGSTSMKLRIEQLIQTVKASDEENPVYLQIEGSDVKAIGGEGITVPQPLSMPLTEIQESQETPEIHPKEEFIEENAGE